MGFTRYANNLVADACSSANSDLSSWAIFWVQHNQGHRRSNIVEEKNVFPATLDKSEFAEEQASAIKLFAYLVKPKLAQNMPANLEEICSREEKNTWLT